MITYWDYYNANFAPKLEEIDLFLKTSESDIYTIEEISTLLDISCEEIKELMCKNNISRIDKLAFFNFMKYGSSKLCMLFNRLLQKNIPQIYTIDDISYIYELPYDTVSQAVSKTKLETITDKDLKNLFCNICT